ncbi:unnamed protein product [Urochloa decumbens]|uniref:Uncharacterized protein n=1 Tax=Urochloa decumbens TaxID=240449 RepID=A0ABC8XFT2_9POAL
MASSSSTQEPRGLVPRLAPLRQQPVADALGAVGDLLRSLRDGSRIQYQIDILKRLQREAFYDIMKLRETTETWECGFVVQIYQRTTCDDFSTHPNIQEEHWLANLRASLRPPLLNRSHRRAGGLILRSRNFAVSLARLISVAGRSGDADESSRVCTGFGQVSCLLPDDIELSLSAALHGLSAISRKPTTGGCVDFELKFDEDYRIGAWVEINKSNLGLPKWALTLSNTPEDDHGWGVSLRRGTCAKPQLFQLEGFLNLHQGNMAVVRPSIMLRVDSGKCTPDLVVHSSLSF